MDTTFRSQIDSAGSILILLPQKPYFDQVAAALALFLTLKGSNKNVEISCPSEMVVEFSRLVGVDKITSELGNKNLVIRFPNYGATNIERVSYDIEDGEFKLTVIPKPEVTPPVKDQVIINYSGVSADCVILIGGANESHFPPLGLKDLAGAKKIHIGIRELAAPSVTGIISFARPASCASELVGTLIKESGYEVDPDTATNLLLGIEVGSNRFSSEGVTAETFQMTADLIKAGGNRSARAPRPQSFPPGSIPGEVPVAQAEEVEQKEPPKEWLGPKIYKGTSVS